MLSAYYILFIMLNAYDKMNNTVLSLLNIL